MQVIEQLGAAVAAAPGGPGLDALLALCPPPLVPGECDARRRVRLAPPAAAALLAAARAFAGASDESVRGRLTKFAPGWVALLARLGTPAGPASGGSAATAPLGPSSLVADVLGALLSTRTPLSSQLQDALVEAIGSLSRHTLVAAFLATGALPPSSSPREARSLATKLELLLGFLAALAAPSSTASLSSLEAGPRVALLRQAIALGRAGEAGLGAAAPWTAAAAATLASFALLAAKALLFSAPGGFSVSVAPELESLQALAEAGAACRVASSLEAAAMETLAITATLPGSGFGPRCASTALTLVSAYLSPLLRPSSAAAALLPAPPPTLPPPAFSTFELALALLVRLVCTSDAETGDWVSAAASAGEPPLLLQPASPTATPAAPSRRRGGGAGATPSASASSSATLAAVPSSPARLAEALVALLLEAALAVPVSAGGATAAAAAQPAAPGVRARAPTMRGIGPLSGPGAANSGERALGARLRARLGGAAGGTEEAAALGLGSNAAAPAPSAEAASAALFDTLAGALCGLLAAAPAAPSPLLAALAAAAAPTPGDHSRALSAARAVAGALGEAAAAARVAFEAAAKAGIVAPNGVPTAEGAAAEGARWGAAAAAERCQRLARLLGSVAAAANAAPVTHVAVEALLDTLIGEAEWAAAQGSSGSHLLQDLAVARWLAEPALAGLGGGSSGASTASNAGFSFRGGAGGAASASSSSGSFMSRLFKRKGGNAPAGGGGALATSASGAPRPPTLAPLPSLSTAPSSRGGASGFRDGSSASNGTCAAAVSPGERAAIAARTGFTGALAATLAAVAALPSQPAQALPGLLDAAAAALVSPPSPSALALAPLATLPAFALRLAAGVRGASADTDALAAALGAPEAAAPAVAGLPRTEAHRLAAAHASALHEARSELKRRLVILASHLAVEAVRSPGVAGAAPALATLASLLPAVADAMRPVAAAAAEAEPWGTSPRRAAPLSLKVYRGLWAHLAALRLLPEGAASAASATSATPGALPWPSAVTRALKTLALFSPALVPRPSPGSPEASAVGLDVLLGTTKVGGPDTDAAATAAAGLPEGVVADFRAALAAAVAPHLRDAVAALAPPAVVYVRTVLALETLRAAQGVFKAPLLYLGDQGLANAPGGLAAIVASVCDAAFRTFLTGLWRRGRSPARDACLRDHVAFLLAHTAHRYARVRTGAFRYLVDLLDCFPHMLWDGASIRLLLGAVDALAARARRGLAPPPTTPPLPGTGAVATLPVPGMDPLAESAPLHLPGCGPLDVPGSQAELVDVTVDVVELANQWLLRAVVAAPAPTRSVFFSYLQSIAHAPAYESHAASPGLAVALAAAAGTSHAGGQPFARPLGLFDRLSAVLAGLPGRGGALATSGPAALSQGLAAAQAGRARLRLAGGAPLPGGAGAPPAASGGSRDAAAAAALAAAGLAGISMPNPAGGAKKAGAPGASAPGAGAAGGQGAVPPLALGTSAAGFFASAWGRSTLGDLMAFTQSVASSSARGGGGGGGGSVIGGRGGIPRSTSGLSLDGIGSVGGSITRGGGGRGEGAPEGLAAFRIEELPHEEEEDEGDAGSAVAGAAGDDAGSAVGASGGDLLAALTASSGLRLVPSGTSLDGASVVSGSGRRAGGGGGDAPPPALFAGADASAVVPGGVALDPALAHLPLALSFGGATAIAAAVASLETSASGSDATTGATSPLLLLSNTLAPSFAVAAQRRSYYLGALEGAASVYAAQGLSPAAYLPAMVESAASALGASLAATAASVRAEEAAPRGSAAVATAAAPAGAPKAPSLPSSPSSATAAAVRDAQAALHRAAALLVHLAADGEAARAAAGVTRAALSALLHTLVWAPLQAFTVGGMQAAVEAWDWVAAAAPALRPRLLSEVLAAVGWTRAQGWGLFSGAASEAPAAVAAAAPAAVPLPSNPPPVGGEGIRGVPLTATLTPPPADLLTPPLSGSKTGGVPPLPPSLLTCEPHRLALGFLEARFLIARSGEPEELGLLVSGMQSLLADAARLSTAPASFGTRVRLLHLALCVLHAAHYPDLVAPHATPRFGSGAGRGGGAVAPVPASAASPGSPSHWTSELPVSLGASAGSPVSAGGALQPPSFGGVGPTNGLLPGHDGGLAWMGARSAWEDEEAAVSGGSGVYGLGCDAPGWLRPADFGGNGAAPLPGSAAAAAAAASTAAAAGAPVGLSSERWPSLAGGSLALLRERIYRALLLWFESKPSHYEVATSPERVRDDFPYVTSLCRLLKLDARFWHSSFLAPGQRSGGAGATGNTATRGSFTAMGLGGGASAGGTGPAGAGPATLRGLAVMAAAAGTSAAAHTASSAAAGTRGRARSAVASLRLAGSAAAPVSGAAASGSLASSQRPRMGTVAETLGVAAAGGMESADNGASAGAAAAAACPALAAALAASPLAAHARALFAAAATTAPAATQTSAPAASVALAPATAPLVRAPSLRARSAHAALVTPAPGTGAAAAAAACAAQRDLALLLLGHEIDRLVAWHNPTDAEERRLPNEREFSLDAALQRRGAAAGAGAAAGGDAASVAGSASGSVAGAGAPGSAAGAAASGGGGPGAATNPDPTWLTASSLGRPAWAAHMACAWAVSPPLALAVWCRFGRITEATEPLAALVSADPVPVRRCPDAVLLVATRANVEANAPALQHLLVWAPAALPTVLSLLARCGPDGAGRAPVFRHPAVAAYVVRCLRRFSADALVFYLPQLVQALRHDASGLLADFLFTLSSTSMLLAHQLIWCLVSESKSSDSDPKHAPKKADPADVCQEDHFVSQLPLGPGAEGGAGAGATASSSSGASGGAAQAPPSARGHGFQGALPGADPLPVIASSLAERIIRTFPPAARALFELQYAFWDSITHISGRLKTEVAEPSMRRGKIKEFLRDLQHAAERDAVIARQRVYRQARKELKEMQSSLEAPGAGGSGAPAPASPPLGPAAGAGAVPALASGSASGVTAAGTATAAGSTASTAPGLAAHSIDPSAGSAAIAMPRKRTVALAGAVAVLGGSAPAQTEASAAAAEDGGADADAPAPPPAPGAGASRIPDVVYMPTAPSLAVVKVDLDSGRPMQSAAKCPFLLTFTVTSYEGPDATLERERRREERERYRQALRYASATGNTELLAALKAQKRDTAYTRARVAAQHAARMVMKSMRRQRVTVGRRLEHTRATVARELSAARKEVAHGVASVLRGAAKGGRRRSLDGAATGGDKGAATATTTATTALAAATGLASRRGAALGGGAGGPWSDTESLDSARSSGSEDGDSDGSFDYDAYADADGVRGGYSSAEQNSDDGEGGAEETPAAAAAAASAAASLAAWPAPPALPSAGPRLPGARGKGLVKRLASGGGAKLASLVRRNRGGASGASAEAALPWLVASAPAAPGSRGGAGFLQEASGESADEGRPHAAGGAGAAASAVGAAAASVPPTVTPAGAASAAVVEAPSRSRRRARRGGRRAASTAAAAAPRLTPSSDHHQHLLRAACIFKVYDDCRQDALVMQVVQLFKTAFEAAGQGLQLFPYKVLPTRTGSKKIPGGILEVVPDVRSRDEIGKAGFATLHDYFLSMFGRPDGGEYDRARRNMIRSLAAYSVVCYLMWIKDRHNGNLLVSSAGSLIHIDFGFVLGITPGGNLGFESPAFKLTQEMVDIMGGVEAAGAGGPASEHFRYFQELVCRAYILARDNAEAAVALVAGMADSGLPCYHFPDTLARLAGRFRPEENDLRACRAIRADTVAAINATRTVLYDGIQRLQNNIHSEYWL